MIKQTQKPHLWIPLLALLCAVLLPTLLIPVVPSASPGDEPGRDQLENGGGDVAGSGDEPDRDPVNEGDPDDYDCQGIREVVIGLIKLRLLMIR